MFYIFDIYFEILRILLINVYSSLRFATLSISELMTAVKLSIFAPQLPQFPAILKEVNGSIHLKRQDDYFDQYGYSLPCQQNNAFLGPLGIIAYQQPPHPGIRDPPLF